MKRARKIFFVSSLLAAFLFAGCGDDCDALAKKMCKLCGDHSAACKMAQEWNVSKSSECDETEAEKWLSKADDIGKDEEAKKKNFCQTYEAQYSSIDNSRPLLHSEN